MRSLYRLSLGQPQRRHLRNQIVRIRAPSSPSTGASSLLDRSTERGPRVSPCRHRTRLSHGYMPGCHLAEPRLHAWLRPRCCPLSHGYMPGCGHTVRFASVHMQPFPFYRLLDSSWGKPLVYLAELARGPLLRELVVVRGTNLLRWVFCVYSTQEAACMRVGVSRAVQRTLMRIFQGQGGSFVV